MPTASGDIEAIFIKLGRAVECGKLDEELAALGLELIVDPQGLVAINEDDPAFADDHPNGTQRKNSDGKFCCVVFRRWLGKRLVYVCQSDDYWGGYWWFPCRRKSVL